MNMRARARVQADRYKVCTQIKIDRYYVCTQTHRNWLATIIEASGETMELGRGLVGTELSHGLVGRVCSLCVAYHDGRCDNKAWAP